MVGLMEPERTVSANVVWLWVLWTIGVLICLAGGVIVLVWGEDIWARAVGLALFGAEMLVVSAAAVTSARFFLRRETHRLDERIEETCDDEGAGPRLLR